MIRQLSESILERFGAVAFYSRYLRLEIVSGKEEARGLCPLHEEKTPSFFVNVKTGSFHCFGCGRGGGPVQFYAYLKDVTLKDAVGELRRELGFEGGGIAPAGRLRAVAKPRPRRMGAPGAAAAVEPKASTSEGAVAVYRRLLESGRPLCEKALSWWAERGIEPQTLERFGVAYLSRPNETARELKKAFPETALVESGVFRKCANGRLAFQFARHPHLLAICRNGEPAFVQGRRADETGRDKKIPKYCNLTGVSVPGMFNEDVLKGLPAGSRVCVCEGAPDALTLAQEGFIAVGVVGCGAFRPEWVERLSGFEVCLVLDSDDAGKSASLRLQRLFEEAGFASIFVVDLPAGIKDANELYVKRGPEALRQAIERARRIEFDLISRIPGLLRRVQDRSDGFSYRDLAETVYRWFEGQGAIFLVTRSERCLVMFHQKLYEIGSNPAFNALMFSRTGLTYVEYSGRIVWEILRNLCFLRGRRSRDLSWIHTDKDSGRLYVNLHNERNEIVRLSPGRLDLLTNGTNPDGVMLRPADKMAAVELEPTVDPKESVRLLEELVMAPLACEPENRLFICCWILTAFFLDFTSEKALLKLSGRSGSGKTTAARILSGLLYGADHVESATVAYYYADAACNPYLICDNLETEHMSRHITQFLLHVATGISKGKRKAGTDSGTVRESSSTLVAITAIEPLTRHELISRTYDVEFRSIHKQASFMQQEHLERLLSARSRILSGLFELFACEVLPGLQSERASILAAIAQQMGRHPKQRVDSFLTLMVVILKALLKARGEPDGRAWEVVQFWIRYQSRVADETERDTNVGVFLLDALAKEMLARGEDFRREYYLDFEKVQNGDGRTRELQFTAGSSDLLIALQVLSKNKGFRLPFTNTRQLGVRLANESSVLEKAGWTREPEKTIRGQRYHRFTKRLE